MVFGIIVEAERDAAVYSLLIRRIRSDLDEVLSIRCGGVVGIRRQFVGWIKNFQWHSNLQIGKVLVICDSDRRDSQSVEAELDGILNQSGFPTQLTLPVHFYATKCEVETWLIADESAVNRVARDRHEAGMAQAVTGDLETIIDAKSRFRRMLSQAGLPATPAVYEEVAKAADLNRIAERCPYFERFVESVRAC